MPLKQNWTDRDTVTATFLNQLASAVNSAVASLAGKYTKPAGGIPASDLAGNVLDKTTADTIYVPQEGEIVHVNLTSTGAGGDDDFDSTSRITLESYQTGGSHDFGESIRLVMRGDHSKQMLAWQDGFSSPGRIANPKTVVWAGAHYGAQEVDVDNPAGTIHGHWAVEIPGADMALRTRFEILYVDTATWQPGIDHTIIRTGGADFIVTCNGADSETPPNGNALRIAGGNDWNKDLVFTNQRDTGNSFRRWIVRSNSTTEDGSQNGSDFEIMRQTTTTTPITALFIKRSSGRIGLGGNRDPQAALHMTTADANAPMMRLEPSVTMTNPLIRAQTATNQETIVSGRITTDTDARVIFRVDGKFEWGSGTAARDTVLWRVGAGVLRTENTFDVQQNLRIGANSTTASAGAAGGVGVLALFNAATVPTGTPTGGGVVYVESGALKYRGSSGTITTLAPA